MENEHDICTYCDEDFPKNTLYTYGLSGMKIKICQRCLVDRADEDGKDQADDE